MTTDQIQKVLYEKSDAQTKAAVEAVLAPVSAWRGNGNGNCKILLPVAPGVLLDREGKSIRSQNTYDSVQDIKNALGYARLELTIGNVLEALREGMFALSQPKDRLAYVNGFIAEVENLRSTADELADRVQGLENNAN